MRTDGVRVVAPWALSRKLPTAFLGRRYAPGCRGWPGWPLLEGLFRLWAGSDTGRNLQIRFWMRRWLGWILRLPIGTEGVTAPSLAAREPFARCKGKRTLVLDLPLLRELHADLDRAAVRHPESAFLHRFRAPAEVVARQEAELVLADEVVVFGHYVSELLSRRGIRCLEFPHPTQPPIVTCHGDVLLAGLATARNGACEALALLERCPDLRLRVRGGEGAEASLLAHPRAIQSSSLEGVRMVLAPAWVESYPVEVRQAAALGIPVVATRRAAGFAQVKVVEPGDVEALVAAVTSGAEK